MYKINRSIRNINVKYLVFLAIGCLLFFVSDLSNCELSREQFLLQMITEHYYITYFMIPVFLVMLFKQMEKEQVAVIIRYTSFWRYFKHRIFEQVVFVVIFMSAQFCVMFCMAITLPQGNKFLSQELSKNMKYEVITEYGKYFDKPISAFLVASLYMGIGLLIVAIAVIWIEHFFETKTASKIIILMYLLMVAGLKVPVMSNIPFLCMDNYIVFHRNFYYKGKLAVNVVSVLILCIFICSSMKYAWYRIPSLRRKNKIGIQNYYRKILFSRRNVVTIVGIAVLLTSWLGLQFAGQPIMANDYFSRLLGGVVLGSRNIMLVIFSLVITFTPIYIVLLFLEREVSSQGIVSTIRLKKTSVWYHAVIRNAMRFFGLYILVIVSSSLFILMIAGTDWNGLTCFRTVAMLSLVKYMDILFQFFLMFVMYCYSHNVTISFCIGIGINLLLSTVGLFHISSIDVAVIHVIGSSLILLVLHAWSLNKAHQRLLIQ